jgi:hypothetical protein
MKCTAKAEPVGRISEMFRLAQHDSLSMEARSLLRFQS